MVSEDEMRIRLIKNGFIRSGAKSKYVFDEKKLIYKPVAGKYEKNDADAEYKELVSYSPAMPDYIYTGFPNPKKRHELIWENYNMNIEEPYYWILKFAQSDAGWPYIIKTEDVFSAAENSAFGGLAGQRLGIQQDKISGYLATIGKMIKDLFQIVRELRILKERLDYYEGAAKQLDKPIEKREKRHEITLKDIFINFAQGGSKNPSSVFGMARELEFTVLPDLFFDAPPLFEEEIDKHVDSLEFNEAVRRVLRRHLETFNRWKERTHEEVTQRKRFMLKYLRQHYEAINMYLVWLKPYLRAAKRLTSKDEHYKSAEMVTAFETSMLDLEFLAYKKGKAGTVGVVVYTFNFRTKPSLNYQQDYQRGAVHVGKVTINFRGYTWTQEELDAYIRMKENEGLDLIGDIYSSVKESLDSMGDEMFAYIKESGKEFEEEEEPKPKKKGLLETFFGDFVSVAPKKAKPRPGPSEKNIEDAKKGLELPVYFLAFNSFKLFKKAHRMFQW